MYKVFLVEDEIVTREGIRNSIPWDETIFTLVGEAPDGEMALHALRDIKPDILITDIKMPFMDGLALSRIIKRDFPWIKIIVLSGHDEFQYAREALSIGVEEYLLKPISSVDMLESLKKVAQSLEEDKKLFNDMENLKIMARSNEDHEREKWFFDLISGQLQAESILDRAESMGMNIMAESYVVMISQFSSQIEHTMPLNQIRKIMDQILQARDDVIICCQSMEKEIILIKNETNNDLNDRIYSLAQAVKYEAERKLQCSVSIGIGSSVNRLSEICRSYNDAENVLRYLLLKGQNTITGIHDLKGFSSISEDHQAFILNGERSESRNQGKVVQAKKYIEEHYMDPDISLDSLASLVNVSSNHFSTLFSQEEGQTFIEYLTKTRLKYAKEFLVFSNMKCSDITYEVGYRDPHYFSYIFKKNTGISPRDYRKKSK